MKHKTPVSRIIFEPLIASLLGFLCGAFYIFMIQSNYYVFLGLSNNVFFILFFSIMAYIIFLRAEYQQLKSSEDITLVITPEDQEITLRNDGVKLFFRSVYEKESKNGKFSAWLRYLNRLESVTSRRSVVQKPHIQLSDLVKLSDKGIASVVKGLDLMHHVIEYDDFIIFQQSDAVCMTLEKCGVEYQTSGNNLIIPAHKEWDRIAAKGIHIAMTLKNHGEYENALLEAYKLLKNHIVIINKRRMDTHSFIQWVVQLLSQDTQDQPCDALSPDVVIVQKS